MPAAPTHFLNTARTTIAGFAAWCSALLLVACAPEPPIPTGIIHDPGERARDLAAIQEEAARKRDAEEDAREREAIAARLREKQEAKEAAQRKREEREAARAAKCSAEKAAQEAASAGLEAEVTRAKETRERREKAEKWIKSHCKALAEKVYTSELYTDAKGNVRRREVQTGIANPFDACPATTPENIAKETGLFEDDDLGWIRRYVPTMPPTAEEYRAKREKQIAAMPLPDCD